MILEMNLDSNGVSPVISVVLLIAIVVLLGALGSAYFFDVGQNSDSSLPSDVSLKNNVGNGYLNTTILKGSLDTVYILKNGTIEKKGFETIYRRFIFSASLKGEHPCRCCPKGWV